MRLTMNTEPDAPKTTRNRGISGSLSRFDTEQIGRVSQIVSVNEPAFVSPAITWHRETSG